MTEPETIGQEIRRRRKALNLTQKGLAELLNTSQSQVARWERDAVIPLRRWQLQISSALFDEERMHALLANQELTGEDALFHVVQEAFNEVILKFKRPIYEICCNYFIIPEIEKIRSQRNDFDPSLIQLVFKGGNKGTAVRFNEDVKIEFITKSSKKNDIPGAISQQDMKNINQQGIEKITAIEEEKGIFNLVIFISIDEPSPNIFGLDMSHLIKGLSSKIVQDDPSAKRCLARDCQNLFSARGDQKKFCSPQCGSRERLKRWRRNKKDSL